MNLFSSNECAFGNVIECASDMFPIVVESVLIKSLKGIFSPEIEISILLLLTVFSILIGIRELLIYILTGLYDNPFMSEVIAVSIKSIC